MAWQILQAILFSRRQSLAMAGPLSYCACGNWHSPGGFPAGLRASWAAGRACCCRAAGRRTCGMEPGAKKVTAKHGWFQPQSMAGSNRDLGGKAVGEQRAGRREVGATSRVGRQGRGLTEFKPARQRCHREATQAHSGAAHMSSPSSAAPSLPRFFASTLSRSAACAACRGAASIGGGAEGQRVRCARC